MRCRISLVVALAISFPFAWQQAEAQSKTTRPPDRREREQEEEREREGKRPVMSSRSGPDEPEEMEDLTRELWKFARGKGYDRAVRRANASAARFAAQTPQLRLPTGWVLAPAGAQVELGRMPYEAVSFGGRVVVLNNGYYLQGLEDPEISIVDVAGPRVTRTLRVASLIRARSRRLTATSTSAADRATASSRSTGSSRSLARSTSARTRARSLPSMPTGLPSRF